MNDEAFRRMVQESGELGLYDGPQARVCLTHERVNVCRKQGAHVWSEDPADVRRIAGLPRKRVRQKRYYALWTTRNGQHLWNGPYPFRYQAEDQLRMTFGGVEGFVTSADA